MAKISVSFEKAVKNDKGEFENQELIISAEANSLEEAQELGYDAFRFDLFINGKFIADISHVLAKAGVMEKLIDDEDWDQQYKNQKLSEVKVTVYDSIKIQ